MKAFAPILLCGLLATLGAQAGWMSGKTTHLGTLAGDAEAWEREVSNGSRAVRVSGVSFHIRDCQFRVVDNPPLERRSLASVLADIGGVAGVNGGYFHQDFTPIGLVVADSVVLHGFEKAKLLSGYLSVRGSRTELLRASAFTGDEGMQEALQAGPWLVEGGQVVAGLNSERLARRTIVATDGRDRWALITTSPITLSEAAEVLSIEGLCGDWNIRAALNLDGGSSTMLQALSGSRPIIDIPSFGPVRNYLAIVPRRR